MHISVVNAFSHKKRVFLDSSRVLLTPLVSPLFTFFLLLGKWLEAIPFYINFVQPVCLTLSLSLGSPGVHTGVLSSSQFLHTHKVRLLLVSFELYIVILMCSP